MNIFRLAFELFTLYLIYKLVFDFIIPVVKTTRQVKNQFNNMHTQMKDNLNKQSSQTNFESTSNQPPKPPKEDYIEFEEIK